MRKLFFLIGGLFLLGSCTAVSLLAYEINRFGEQDQTRPAEAAIVLGAGVWRGRPSPVFRERLNHAIALYQQGYVDKIIFTGGIGRGDELSEAAVGRAYAIENGVNPADTLLEETSTNTVENLRNAQRVAQANDIESFLIVSTSFHMMRALDIADRLGMEAYSSPTRTIRWINGFTRNRALVQEVISYTRYLVVGLGDEMNEVNQHEDN
ncbi:MAG: YdcF family protein [Anaerolineales bacterium]|nr:YdcF family protein [Anaerolineales bacterium]